MDDYDPPGAPSPLDTLRQRLEDNAGWLSQNTCRERALTLAVESTKHLDYPTNTSTRILQRAREFEAYLEGEG